MRKIKTNLIVLAIFTAAASIGLSVYIENAQCGIYGILIAASIGAIGTSIKTVSKVV